ncbi:Eco57I restriction-modification methylase [Mariniphaga anaerophila]|uniref:site-specific DNA-methyltransferase (adenine-specific) n=1 Tax=Mariniphaga anaerophila TaxID=1484053 RepID=A0A1M5GFR3_9BACT|nr:TaqI-like C-terminal specificity domain-containing protein [Mariniphaga anaerophila]SHG02630.1 Eco57I restriction-modification methylase [Mariniphaga anaerophila]
MAANRIQLQNALHKPYDRVLFAREVLNPVFSSGFNLSSGLIPAPVAPNKSESAAIDRVWIYGNILLDDSTEITCYEVLLQPSVRIEHSKVAIQHYIRKLLTAGQAALINFVAPSNKNVWRLTLVAKDSVLTEKGVKEKTTNAKRYTFLLGPSETCKTAAERFEVLSTEKEITFQTLVNAFSVEKLSKAFFDEYTLHYQNFCDYLQESNYRKSVFNISFPANATKEEKDKASKPIRDFVKKLLGRIVFLYFVQKKGWLGASNTNYSDGLGDFIKRLFKDSGGNNAFYSNWLTVLFFNTLNKERANDDFKMPNGKIVKVPFLNGGLFDKEEFDEHLLTFKSKLFHHPDFEDDILTAKSNGNARGFLDFLDSFNFTVYEDSPDDHTVAVDPEMLGHIFENLLEDNKDKGTFYTPKEIVYYMCQESLTEYLCTTLQIKDEVAERKSVNKLLKDKIVDDVLKPEIAELEKALDNVKICDPAIGSGAFPMGLLLEIFSIKELIAYETGKEWKPAETKLNIIQNSIYGVDIEKGAVDIARLRFWLSLVVEEEKPKSLPNLDYKIVVGDSLISKFDGKIVEIDWERKQSVGKANEYVKNVQRLLVEVAFKQKNYFNPNNKNKHKLQAEIRNLKIELLINQLSFNKELFVNKFVQKGGFMPTSADIKHNTEREIQIRDFENLINQLRSLLKNSDVPFNHFNWKLDFPEILNPLFQNSKGGFDIVIANPPFVSIEGIEWDDRRYYETKYKTAKGRFDLYSLFIEKAQELKLKDGVFIYIIPGKFLNNKQFVTARKMLCENQSVLVVKIDEKVFENAQVDNVIVENYSTNVQTYKAFKLLRNDFTLVSETSLSNILKDKEVIFKIEINETTELLLTQIETNSKRIKEIAEVKDGIVAGAIKDVLFMNSKKDKDSHKLYFGKQLNRYSLADTNVWVNYKPNEMMQLEVKRKGNKRPGLWMRDKNIFEREKILYRKVGKEVIATYGLKGIYYEQTIHSCHILNKSILTKYVLAIFNSNVIKYYYRNTNSQGGDIFPQVRISSVEKLPIKIVSLSIQNVLVTLVDYVLLLKKVGAEISISNYFERLIDASVYEIYFSESVKLANAEVIIHLKDLKSLSNADDELSIRNDFNTVKLAYKTLTNKQHKVDAALLKLKNVKEVQLIEGK